jgi:putative salt-induced outer membrane protein YdiY
MRADYLYSWFMSDHWFLQVGFGGERDPVRELNRRLSAGGGLGYRFFDDAHRRLEVSLSAVGVDEEIGGDANQSLAARWSADFRQDLLDGNLEFFHEQSVWDYLSGRANTLIQTSTGFRWDVWGDIYFNTQLDWDYETDPPQGVENQDIWYKVGLGVEFD